MNVGHLSPGLEALIDLLLAPHSSGGKSRLTAVSQAAPVLGGQGTSKSERHGIMGVQEKRHEGQKRQATLHDNAVYGRQATISLYTFPAKYVVPGH